MRCLHKSPDERFEYFGPPCGRVGPAGIAQADHNYYYNCVFAGDDVD